MSAASPGPFRCGFGVSVLAATVLLGGASRASAHAVLVHSSLQGAPVPAETPTEVTLRFNAAIEVALSRALLVNAEGEERQVPVTPGGSPSELVVRLPPLPAGSYGLRYKVLASDGHLTDAILRFPVSAPR